MPAKKAKCSICGSDFDYYSEQPPMVEIVKESWETQSIKVCLNHYNLLSTKKNIDERKTD